MSALVPFDNWNEYRTTGLKRVEGLDLSSKIYVVTGATGLLGLEIAYALASAKATVVLTGRTTAKIDAAKKKIQERVAGENAEEFGKYLDSIELDLSDYDSIEGFVATLTKKYPDGVDCFINNAGIVPSASFATSKYGWETTFQSNFLSQVILTEMVLPVVEKKKGRFVHVSSMSHADATKPINFDTIPSTEETFGGYNKDYCESKWLLTAYSAMLAKRGYESVCADPGASPGSKMWDVQPLAIRILARYVFRFLTKTATQSAGCATNLAVAETVESGGYYQSGVLTPPMREDTVDPKEWAKVTAVLEKTLPDKYKKFAIKVE
mmetsp:Transcript_17071/g.46818  ORF Transcript_17071/g.46818 Transcript_17071/m.46818 type:complete len:323 (-) Transcript_17071:1269-2237(-)